MKTDDFNKVMEKLSNVINACAEIKSRIDSAGDIENLTLKEFNKLVVDSKNLQIRLDKIFCAEVYHIIGMGNLDAVQTQTFCKGIRQLGGYRYLIKRLAFKDTINFTDKSKDSKYVCEVLGITLKAENTL